MASDATTLFQGLFLGEYDHTLDAQCRVSLPSDWRNREGSTELVLIPARGKALVLLPIQTFLEFVEKSEEAGDRQSEDADGICLSGVAFAAVPL
ncbi:MAG: MraZ N-terminal domain containing protein [Lentisphaeria bacterium]|nr:MAG: MraZ N-terminal domain containing protein [Lentisphaeria bacterium]